PEPDNRYDKNAIELYLGEEKLGYIPREQNREMAKITDMQWDIFQVIVAGKNEDEHPNNMVKIAVYVLRNPNA
ncbi:MAG: HIRAN domain-containing protein, partial [Luteibaculum sp.]